MLNKDFTAGGLLDKILSIVVYIIIQNFIITLSIFLRFSPSPGISPPPGTESVFWRFEKLSTNSTSSYDTAQLSGDSLSDKSPYRTNSSYDSPRSKAWTQSSGESSVWTEEGSPVGPSPPHLLSPKYVMYIVCFLYL